MRSEQLHALRSEIPLDTERNSLEIEQFQNNCLRPILKYQHDAILLYFESQIAELEVTKSKKDQENLIKLRFQKDIITRNVLMGMVLGLMTVDELTFYTENKNELSRRIVTMLTQRMTGELKVRPLK